MIFLLPKTLVKSLAKNLVKNLAKNLGEGCLLTGGVGYGKASKKTSRAKFNNTHQMIHRELCGCLAITWQHQVRFRQNLQEKNPTSLTDQTEHVSVKCSE